MKPVQSKQGTCISIVKFEEISHIVLVFSLLTLNKYMRVGLFFKGNILAR